MTQIENTQIYLKIVKNITEMADTQKTYLIIMKPNIWKYPKKIQKKKKKIKEKIVNHLKRKKVAKKLLDCIMLEGYINFENNAGK